MHRLLTRVFLLLLLLGCKNEGYVSQNNTNNTNNTGNYVLSFFEPLSGELNLLSASDEPLWILVSDADGSPVPGAQVDFLIVGQAGGSSLSSSFALTDENGLAGIDVHSGTSASHFSIAVTQSRAAPLSLDVTVTESGMADFSLDFSYTGSRLGELHSMEVGILFETTCDATSMFLASFSRRRTLTSVNELVQYADLPVDIPFVFGAKILGETGDPVGYGCMAPPPESLVPGGNASLTLSLSDYLLTLDGTQTMSLPGAESGVSDWLTNTLPDWHNLGRCTYGVGTKLLDCLVSWLEGGDAAACQRGTPTLVSEEIIDLRGIIDGSSCRGSLNSHGGTSLEAAFHNLSPDIQALQHTLTNMRQFLELAPFEQITVDTLISSLPGEMTISISSITFPVAGSEPHALAEDLAPDAFSVTGFDGILENLIIPDSFYRTGVGRIALNILWARFLAPYSLPLDGPQIMESMKGYIQEGSTTTWQEELISLFNSGLNPLDVERAFTLFGNLLLFTLPATTHDDLLMGGSLLFSDENRDGIIDNVVPTITITVDPGGNL
ncbi:hypothetical protein KKF84_12590 [Myxococcota bacterium]|nr:hypothetical protein [Myxococcota bacterium]MBU1536153.1 hypothetical protein [Myxococcota bacterium]